MRLSLVAITVASLAGCRSTRTGVEPAAAAVARVLSAQRQAWNRGDIESFMQHYWNSDELTFSSGGKTHRGWQATLQRYRERYPTAAEMGTVTFSNLEVQQLADDVALALGRWEVQARRGTSSGNFSLVLRRFDGRWLIVHDHTSSDP